MVSANLLMAFLQFCLNKCKIAEINVPAWPIPTHQTKLIIAHPQKTGLLIPHTPVPSQIKKPTLPIKIARREREKPNNNHHWIGVFFCSGTPAISSVIEVKS